MTPAGRPLTAHAQESLRRHGFQEPFGQVDDIIDHATHTTSQADGATVYIQRTGTRSRKYNIVIEGDEGIVTGMRNLSKHELENLGRNHGFNPSP
jgi:filamentous hemagglutinin